MKKKTDSEKAKIAALFDGKRSSKDVAKILGFSARYMRKIAKKNNYPQLQRGAQPGENNHQYVSGRRIDPDGYVLVTAPKDHPYARRRSQRQGKLMFEHRLVLEQKLGRYLLPEEVVDHIDGLSLHNDPANLRLFAVNGDHLHETIAGRPKQFSVSGLDNMKAKNHLPEDFQRIDTYGRRRKRGDVKLRQILLAALKLGIDSPFLLGTHRFLKKKQIDYSSRPNLERALDELSQRWEADLLL